MALCEKILIAGFSGSGKSSLLQAVKLEAPEGWDLFDDLDRLVLKNSRPKYPTIADLVAAQGWEKFRLWERQNLESWLKEEEKGVLALGGGALSPVLFDLLRPIKKVKIVHLNVPFETCWKRLEIDFEVRPLVQLGRLELERIYHERGKLFSQIPWKLENPDGVSLAKTAKEFWSKALDS